MVKSKRVEILEVLLILIGLTLFSGAFVLYITDYPLEEILFGFQGLGANKPVGTLSASSGDTRRKLASRSDFRSVDQSATLFNFDTLVTGPDGSAVITLNDGSTIELGPATMIQLSFGSLFIDGITRPPTVNVIAGQVTGKSQTQKIVVKTSEKEITIPQKQAVKTERIVLPPPVPVAVAKPAMPFVAALPALPDISGPSLPSTGAAIAPQPIPEGPPKPIFKVAPKFTPVSPKKGQILFVQNGSPQAELKTTFKWNREGDPIPVHVEIKRDGFDEPVFAKDYKSSNSQNSMDLKLKFPGKYKWIVRSMHPEASAETIVPFSVAPSYQAIMMFDPLIAGQSAANNIYSGKKLKDFDLQFLWKPYPGAEMYTFQFFRAVNDVVPIFEKKISSTGYVLNKEKVFSGKIWYRVSTELPSGFRVLSDLVPFRFDFLPPKPVLPLESAQITSDLLQRNKGRVLFTWQKTDFTEVYEIEFSDDSNFERNVMSKKLTENFLFLKAPPKGRYFWRVKSHTQGVISAPTAARDFEIL